MKRLYIFTMDLERYAKAKDDIREDAVGFDADGKRVFRLWLTVHDAFKARRELMWFNLGHKDKITMKKGLLTK